MARLIYSMLTSLDGYTEDAQGRFGWSAPKDEEVHRYVNELTSSVGTHLYGRRMYETMVYWESAHTVPGQPEYILEWTRLWQAARKIVYSTTLAEPRSARTRIEREFSPEALRRFKADATQDITVSGPDLAAQAIRAGLVDELHQIVNPVIVGGGKRFFPAGVWLDLELLEERRFRSGVVALRYSATTGGEGTLALRGIWLGVRDMARSRAFYERLGARFDQRGPADGIVVATLGGTRLVFEVSGAGNPSGSGPFLLFDVPDADALYRALLEAGDAVAGPPKDEPWGRQFNVRDPDGHSIALIGTRPTTAAPT